MRVVRRLLLVVLGFLLLLELVPRFVPIPGLRRADLAPEYVESTADKAFEPHPYLVLAPKPNYVRPAESGKQFSHDARGFRGDGMALEKPEGAFRIACIGGSSTYGTGPSSDEHAWPHLLRERLTERVPGTTIEVLNAGAPSWTTFESVGNLAFRVLPYRPDVVLIFHGTNDVKAALWPGATHDNTHYRIPWPVFRPSPLEPLLERSVTYLVWRRYATDYLSQRADLDFYGIRNYDPSWRPPYGDGPLPDQGFVNFRRNLVTLVAIARAHGARPVLLTQYLWSTEPDSDSPVQGASMLAGMERITAITHDVASERNVPLIDMRAHMAQRVEADLADDGRQELFLNNVHMRDAGTAVFARHLAEELVRLRLVP